MQQPNAVAIVLPILARSLLQYSATVWPWTREEDAAARDRLSTLARRQQEDVRKLAEALDAAGETPDFGIFPDWSDLHYVSLEYLLNRVVANQRDVVARIRDAAQRSGGEPATAALLAEVLQSEESILGELQTLEKETLADATTASA